MSLMDGGPERTAPVFPWLVSYRRRINLSACKSCVTPPMRPMLTGRLSELEEIIDEWRATGLAAWDEKRLRGGGEAEKYNTTDPIPLARPR